MSNVMNCFVAEFTRITSFSTMFFILYILSEYIWEKPNNQNKYNFFHHDPLISLLREYKKENYKKAYRLSIHYFLNNTCPFSF